jgi:hypothetical protein
MGRYFRVFAPVIAIVGALAFQTSWAYVPTVNSSGSAIRWKGPVQLYFAGNPVNLSNLSPNNFYDAVVQGLQRWQFASSGSVKFDYWQGSDPKDYLPNSEYNGLSSIYFASNSRGESHLSQNVLGLTQVWYNTDSGEILETDIVLNDRDFYFTNNPTDTSGYGSGGSTFTSGKSNVYIQNVITHEFGHALGLSHSGGLQSTMLFMESPEQAHLGCDEQVAIHALYPSGDQNQRGSITGKVLTESGAPTFGAHVLAISTQRGTVLATALTNQSGDYRLDALEPGIYYLMTEPFYAGAPALPSYYSNSNPAICQGGNPFSRSFLTEPNGFSLIPISVSSAGVASAPPITAHCNDSGGASVSQLASLMSSVTGLTTLPWENQLPSNFALVDQLTPTQALEYRIPSLSGHIEIHAVSYSLYSPIHPSLTLISTDGNDIHPQVSDPVYRGDSGYINYDTSLIAENLPPGDYILKIASRRLQANDYPAGPISLDSTPFVVITGSNYSETPFLSSVLPTNARCRGSEAFPSYQSPPGLPRRSPLYQGDSGGGFCGTIRDKSKPPRPPLGPGAIFAWFLPWVICLTTLRFLIRLQRSSRTANL